MASSNTDNQTPSNVTERRQPVKKKPRLSAPSSKTNTPNAYSRRSPPREQQTQRKPRSPSPARSHSSREGSRSPPRKLKRPGAGARFNAADRQAAEAARRRREEEDRRHVYDREQAPGGGGRGAELVASHYNSVPERGREWRKTDSEIKGLRSLNNWVKSTLIQKFSVPEEGLPPGQQGLLVLDMACGKGGDLGKWEKAPVVPALYVGCDIADVSVEQARARWDESLRKGRGRGRERQHAPPMQAEFYVQDAFAGSLSDIHRVREVGFNPNAGPTGGPILPGMPSGGFDVVSIMFALHYSYESEALARGMLKNVAGALKKGGRFFGVMPDSDVVSERVRRLLVAERTGKTPNGAASGQREGDEEGEIKDDEEEDDWDPEKPSEPNGDGVAPAAADEEDDDWDPEKPSEPQPQAAVTTNGTNATQDEDNDDWDPEKPSSSTSANQTAATSDDPQQLLSTSPAQTSEHSTLPPLEWGNKIYTVRFPRNQPLTKRPLPKDGIFRPPYGWKYHYHLAEAVDVPEFVVPWEAFRALGEEYGLELLYRKGFREVLEDEGMGDRSGDPEGLGRLAQKMGVLGGRTGRELLVSEEEMEAAGFYHAFCFYRT